MTMKHVKRVTFLCPVMQTGGPEAIHQAAQVLNQEGVHADIMYIGPGAAVDVVNGRVLYTPPSDNPCLDVYQDYEPVLCRGALLRRHHLFVLPEVYCGDHAAFPGASVAIWWLSVDNVFVTTDALTRNTVLTSRTLQHFHQSAYAAEFLRGNGVRTSSPLFDYTTAEFTSYLPTSPNSQPAVAYNPAKGADLAEAFFTQHPDHAAAPIRGMGKTEIVALLRTTAVYVDFGHLPGKDRLPREAAASGAVVFVRDAGAGRFEEDFPVPPFFRFNEDDIHSGELARRITHVQQDLGTHWAQQDLLRRRVRGEREELRGQIRALWGTRRAA